MIDIPNPFSFFTDPNQRVYWGYLFVALIIATIIFIRQTENKISAKGWLNFIFPKEIYFHKSTQLDALFFVINKTLFLLLFFPALNYISPVFAQGMFETLNVLFGQQTLYDFSGWHIIIVTVVFLLLSDFAVFLAHYLQHKVPFLWQFHKVHHSAIHLTPLTVYRMHPVDDLLTIFFGSCLFGFANGLIHYFFPMELKSINIYDLNIVVFAFYLLGYNLRHSHIWLSYGPIVSKVLISPAQHQIHHSSLPEHIDKNFGLIFSFWDNLFNTLYIPKTKEHLILGLTKNEHKDFQNLNSLFWYPFALAKRTNPFYFSVILLILVGVIASSAWLIFNQNKEHNSLWLEELTTNEVARFLEEGYDTVIIPTGGTEQNGNHLTLGKHNEIIAHTANEIAKRLGATLIAPTVTYVPEGNINPPEGHMRFAGTISISEETFTRVLVESADSLASHGFKKIIFLGDSGGNIKPQEEAVTRLSNTDRLQSTTFINAYNYYLNNFQKQFLINAGFTAEQIGDHAGIRDTSELMYVNPGSVRDLKLPENTSQLDRAGAYWRSNEELGKKLLELKIDAAVTEIQEQLKGHKTTIRD